MVQKDSTTYPCPSLWCAVENHILNIIRQKNKLMSQRKKLGKSVDQPIRNNLQKLCDHFRPHEMQPLSPVARSSTLVSTYL
jgi:hypothetical protein